MKEFVEAPDKIYSEAKKDGRLIENSSLEELKRIALRQEGVRETQMGSVAVDSEPMSRAAPKTENSIDSEFGEEEILLANQAVEILRKRRVVSLDAPIGEEDSEITVRFLMPEKYGYIAYGLKLLFGGTEGMVVDKPTYRIIFFTDDKFEANKRIKDVRDKDVTIRLWMGHRRGEQTKICRNSTYLGEGKKGVFQFEDWRVKEIDKEGIFLHAGIRIDHLWVYDHKTERPELIEKGTAITGLTATGKTTTICRKLARMPRERSMMIGDDGGTLRSDGSFTVFEPMGVYIKTDGIDHEQPEILGAALSSDAYLENVSLSKYPYIPEFSNVTKTRNGRAVVLRKNIRIASRKLRANRVDNIILLSRNPLMNGISKLTSEQATMQLIYGESVESSGGIAVEEGKFKRVFFLDPFVVGNRLEHTLKFYNILNEIEEKRETPINCYLANTGYIGEKMEKVELWDSLAVYIDLLKESIKFSNKPDALGYYYPVKCDRGKLSKLVALDKFPPHTLEEKIQAFLKGRREYIREFESKWGPIPPKIKNSLRYH